MIRLTDVTEENWTTLLSLSVRDDQKKYLAPPVGILARAYKKTGVTDPFS